MPADREPRTPLDLIAMKGAGRKIAVLTCYDAAFARLLAPEVDLLLVGDSVNQVVAGRETTLTATLEQLIYHAAAVRRGSPDSLIVVDLPFLSYQVAVEEAIRNAGRVLQETGAQAVKLEGGAPMLPTIRALVERGIPVMGHLGLTPQSVHALGGVGGPPRCRRARDRRGRCVLTGARAAADDAGTADLGEPHHPDDRDRGRPRL